MKNTDSKKLAERVATMLEEKHGKDCVIIDVNGTSSVTDYFVIVTGNNRPHLKAMFSDVLFQLKHDEMPCYRKVDQPDSGWLVLDYVDVVIHIFLKSVRQHYAIEDLLAEAPREEEDLPRS